MRLNFRFVLSCLVSGAVSFPHTGLVNQGPQLGPLTPAFGDLVQTPRGLASIALEGFSEDLDQDGYVDPVAQATVPVAVAHAAPIAVAHAAPTYTYAAAPAAVAYAAPAYTYAAAQATVAHAAAPVAVAGPAYTYNFAAPQQFAAVAAPAYAYNYGAPLAAAAHIATSPVAVAAAPLAAVHHHSGCVNNFGAIVPCAL